MRFVGSVSRAVALIVLLCNVTARPGLRHIDCGALYGRSYGDMTVRDPSRNLTNPLSAAVHKPSKRMMPGVTPMVNRIKMNLLFFESIRPIIPIQMASKFLAEFYAQIALNAGGAWTQLPRKHSFSVRDSNFVLSFRSLGDSIPWDIIKDIAERMWEHAVMGLADLFEATYFDPLGQVGLKVSMLLADASLSSEGDDFREGSVPSVTGPDMSYQNGT